MLRRLLLVLGAIALLPTAPAAAQEGDAAAADQAIRQATRKMFPTDPLTPEQEARLPAARALADIIVAPGTYATVMSPVARATMRPMLGMLGLGRLDTLFVQGRLGLSAEQWRALPETSQDELAHMFDPARDERARVHSEIASEYMQQALTAMEPSIRRAIAEIYAQRFTQAQLADIATFFATPTGATYAAQWLGTTMDPRMLAASAEVLPRMMPALSRATQRLEAAMNRLGERRNYSELSNTERDRVAELVGIDRATLEQQVAAAAAERPVAP